jgi:PsbN protein
MAALGSRLRFGLDTVGVLVQIRPNLSRDVMETSSPALSVAIAVLAVLLGLTGFGVYTAFGPPSKKLDDPFDDHDD